MRVPKQRHDQPSERPHIVVGVDNTAGSAAALRWAATETERTGWRLIVVHAVCDEGVDGRDLGSDDEAAARARTMRWLIEILGAAGWPVRAELRIATGDAGPALVEAADDAAVLVVGVNDPDPWERPSRRIARYCQEHAACPVVVINQVGQPLHTTS